MDQKQDEGAVIETHEVSTQGQDLVSCGNFSLDKIPEHVTTFQCYQYTTHVSGGIANVGNNPTIVGGEQNHQSCGHDQMNRIEEKVDKILQASDQTVARPGDAESIVDAVDESCLKKEFGENWFQPVKLVIRPQFIVDQYNISLTLEKHVEFKLKLAFFNGISKVLAHKNTFSGYLIFDFDLRGLRPGDHMKVHAALFSRQLFRIIEFVDSEDSVEEAERKLSRMVHAIKNHIDNSVPVDGVVILPHKIRLPTSILSPDDSILYKDELLKLLIPFNHSSGISNRISRDVKIAFAKMLHISFMEQRHPETKEEAICRAAHKLFLQRPEEKIRWFSQIDFNLIKLTNIQDCIKHDLLAGNTLIWGSYGIGKSVAILVALKESIRKHQQLVRKHQNTKRDIRIVFLSAQGLLADGDLNISPFLFMIETWIKQACVDLGCANSLELLNYTGFLDRNIEFVMQAEIRSKSNIIFCSYLLKTSDINLLKENICLIENFDIIVIEETHALDSNVIKQVATGFRKVAKANKGTRGRNSKLWMTSNAEKLDMNLPGFKVSPSSNIDADNLRNVPAIARLAEAVNTDIAPERYPSATLPVSSVTCHINATYEFEWNDKTRLMKVVELAKKWKQVLPKASILFLECEDSALYEELRSEGILVKTYEDVYSSSSPLFLRRSDPVEAILAGAEWHIMIVHIKLNTANSIEVTKLLNKRIISRITTKIYIFSDCSLNIGPQKDVNFGNDEITESVAIAEDSVKVEDVERRETEESDDFQGQKFISDRGTTGYNFNLGIFINAIHGLLSIRGEKTSDDIDHLVEGMRKMHHRIASLDEKLSDFEGYTFSQVRHLDSSLRDTNTDIYVVFGEGKAFLVQLDPDIRMKHKIIKVQTIFESLWNVRIPAYCGSVLVSPSKTENVTCVSKLLYLLLPKMPTSRSSSSGFLSVSAEDAHLFAKNARHDMDHAGSSSGIVIGVEHSESSVDSTTENRDLEGSPDETNRDESMTKMSKVENYVILGNQRGEGNLETITDDDRKRFMKTIRKLFVDTGVKITYGKTVADVPNKKIREILDQTVFAFCSPEDSLEYIHKRKAERRPSGSDIRPIAGITKWKNRHESAYIMCTSLYERCETGIVGDPIADCAAIITKPNSAILVLADGASYQGSGEKSRLAACSAVYGCITYLSEDIRDAQTTREVCRSLLRSFETAHNSIQEEEGTMTTLVAGAVVKLYDHDKWGFCVVNVGNSLAFVYSPQNGVREVTVGSHEIDSERDLRYSGGSLRPVDGCGLDLTNLTCSYTVLQTGDIVYLTSDGISDNFDPKVGKFCVESPSSDSVDFAHFLETLTPRKRYEGMLGKMRQLIQEEPGPTMKDTAADVCTKFVNFVVKSTQAKRELLENEGLDNETLGRLTDKERKEKTEELREKLSKTKGKLDHASIVAFQVGHSAERPLTQENMFTRKIV